MCDPDDTSTCVGCDSDYWLNKEDGTTCEQCASGIQVADGCFRCDETECLECLPNYYMVTDATTGLASCSACDLDAFNSQYEIEPNRCSRCLSSDPTSCAVCDIGFLGSTSNPTSCELKCDDGQYPEIIFETLNYNENIISETSGCMSCDSSCKTCALNNTSTDCTSCPDGYYLEFTEGSQIFGTCLERNNTVDASTPIEIYVSNGWTNSSSDCPVLESQLCLADGELTLNTIDIYGYEEYL